MGTVKPQAFIKVARPTDADVDGMSEIYQASWQGAMFNWQGFDAGLDGFADGKTTAPINVYAASPR